MRSILPVLAFTLTYLLASVIGAFGSDNGEFVYYIVVMAVLIAVIGAVHRKVGFSSVALWGLSIWGALHMAGGLIAMDDVGVLYNYWFIQDRLKYDQVIHAYGFGLTTWICWQAIRSSLKDPRPRFGPIVLCWSAGMGFGGLNEVIEFAATLALPNTNVGGYMNTGWDLVANMVGATTAALFILFFGQRAEVKYGSG